MLIRLNKQTFPIKLFAYKRATYMCKQIDFEIVCLLCVHLHHLVVYSIQGSILLNLNCKSSFRSLWQLYASEIDIDGFVVVYYSILIKNPYSHRISCFSIA